MRSTNRPTFLRTRLVALVALVSVLAASCGDDTDLTVDTEPTPTTVTTEAAPPAPVAPPVVPLVVADYLIDGLPFPVPPGAVTLELTNNGEDFHHLQLWRVDDADAAAEAIQAGDVGVLQGGVAIGGVGAIEGLGTVGQVSTVLDPGEYVLFCLIHTPAGAHNELGMVARLDVAGEPIATDLPETAHELLISPYGFQLPQDWDGRAPLTVVNALEWAADAEFLRLADGATRDDFLAFMDGSRPGPPPFAVAGGVAGLGSNRSAVVLDPLDPGDYLVVSFSPDPTADMAPQFSTGLLAELAIR